jgi:hypothetical protein
MQSNLRPSCSQHNASATLPRDPVLRNVVHKISSDVLCSLLTFLLIRIVRGVESRLGPLGTSASNWPIVPAPGDYEEGEFDGMEIGRGNRSARRKPTRAALCPPQISLDKIRVRTRVAAVVSQRLSA